MDSIAPFPLQIGFFPPPLLESSDSKSCKECRWKSVYGEGPALFREPQGGIRKIWKAPAFLDAKFLDACNHALPIKIVGNSRVGAFVARVIQLRSENGN